MYQMEPIFEVDPEKGIDMLIEAVHDYLKIYFDNPRSQIFRLLEVAFIGDVADSINLRRFGSHVERNTYWAMKACEVLDDFLESTDAERDLIAAQTAIRTCAAMEALVRIEAASMRMSYGESVAGASDSGLAYLSVRRLVHRND